MIELRKGDWWHPRECVNAHDEGGNCLDADGSIVGWREELPDLVGAVASETAGVGSIARDASGSYDPAVRMRNAIVARLRGRP